MSLYIDRGLAELKWAFPHSLLRSVRKEEIGCCICGEKNISICVLDWIEVKNGFSVFARLYCEEHRRKWVNYETLDYRNISGLMFVERPNSNPSMSINTPWNEFEQVMEKYTSYNSELIKDSLQAYWTKNGHLIYQGKIDEFVKEPTIGS